MPEIVTNDTELFHHTNLLVEGLIRMHSVCEHYSLAYSGQGHLLYAGDIIFRQTLACFTLYILNNPLSIQGAMSEHIALAGWHFQSVSIDRQEKHDIGLRPLSLMCIPIRKRITRFPCRILTNLLVPIVKELIQKRFIFLRVAMPLWNV